MSFAHERYCGSVDTPHVHINICHVSTFLAHNCTSTDVFSETIKRKTIGHLYIVHVTHFSVDIMKMHTLELRE